MRTKLVGYPVFAALIGVSLLPVLSQTWTPTSAPPTNWVALATSSDGGKVFAAVGGPTRPVGPIFMSTNSGLTWAQSSAPVTNWTRVVCSANGTLVHAASESSVYSSTNSGATWQPFALSPSYPGRWDSLACSADGAIILAAHNFYGTNGWRTEVFVSTNQGVSWINNLFKDDAVLAAAVSADGGQMVCSQVISPDGSAESPGMVFSRDKGQTWIRTYPTFWASGLVCSADGSILAGAIGEVAISTNFAGDWVFTGNANFAPFPAVACSADGRRVVSVGRGIWMSKDTGTTWSQATLPPAPPYLTNWNAVVSSADGCTLYASILGGGIYSWHIRPSPFLRIRPSEFELEFSWTVPSVTFGLEQNSNLSSANWQRLPVMPTLNYSTLLYETKVPKPQGTAFYKLVSP